MCLKKNKEKEPYGGKYSDIMEGEHLIVMREAIEKLDAGKMLSQTGKTDKDKPNCGYTEIRRKGPVHSRAWKTICMHIYTS